jgi:hypothetical protein
MLAGEGPTAVYARGWPDLSSDEESNLCINARNHDPNVASGWIQRNVATFQLGCFLFL